MYGCGIAHPNSLPIDTLQPPPCFPSDPAHPPPRALLDIHNPSSLFPHLAFAGGLSVRRRGLHSSAASLTREATRTRRRDWHRARRAAWRQQEEDKGGATHRRQEAAIRNGFASEGAVCQSHAPHTRSLRTVCCTPARWEPFPGCFGATNRSTSCAVTCTYRGGC